MDFLIDIGNVILAVDFQPSLDALLPADRAEQALLYQKLQHGKDALESGRVSSEEFVTWSLAQIGGPVPRERFLRAWLDVFSPIEPMWREVARLASAGHRLILFSNTNQLHMDHALKRYPVFDRFHGAVFSHEVGAMKPEPAIYQHAVDQFRLSPDTTIYVDDLAENIAAGRQFGFRCWQYDPTCHDPFVVWLTNQLRGVSG